MFSKTSKHRFKTPYIIENNDKKTPIFTSSPPKIHYPMNLPPSSVTQPTDVVPRSPPMQSYVPHCPTCSTAIVTLVPMGIVTLVPLSIVTLVPLSIVTLVPQPWNNCDKSLSPIHSRSKTVQNQWISRRFRSFPFKLVQRFYGRTSKHPQDVRPYPLRTYVHRPFERTSKAPLVVRPQKQIKRPVFS